MDLKKILSMFISVLFTLLCSCDAVEQEIPASWKIELCLRLNKMSAGDSFTTAHNGALSLYANDLESDVAVPAILEMLIRGKHDIELFWWKQENRVTRCFVLALYLCATSERVCWIPEFDLYIERFNEEEKQERKEELEFVLMHRSALAGVIASILQKRNYHSKSIFSYNTYQNMEREKLGKSLPQWCQDVCKMNNK